MPLPHPSQLVQAVGDYNLYGGGVAEYIGTAFRRASVEGLLDIHSFDTELLPEVNYLLCDFVIEI
ncbi:hypothetical protein PIB30_017893 [Stylosanthes scabra]|uniref:Uncharacterized protein n=1 Tax=Stylosanthes scabra TaxID=79078 RepID=A0ABU6Z9H0_9FABA|nr:hypothetical protein [Stylosanthes scabra]